MVYLLQIAVFALSAGLAIAALARYLRRRRRAPPAKSVNRLAPNWKRNRGGVRSPNGGKC